MSKYLLRDYQRRTSKSTPRKSHAQQKILQLQNNQKLTYILLLNQTSNTKLANSSKRMDTAPSNMKATPQKFKSTNHNQPNFRQQNNSFIRQYPYSLVIASISIFENQVVPIGIHNFSKSLRQNLATIRTLPSG